MKFLQSKFEDYIKENKNENLHTELENIFQQTNKIDNLLNVIFSSKDTFFIEYALLFVILD